MEIKNKYLWLIAIIVLIGIISLTIILRTQNIPNLKDVTTGRYTLGPDLDPFLYLRQAKEIVSGSYSPIDKMRQAPVGTTSFAKGNLMPWAIIGVFDMAKIFNPNVSLELAAIISPVIFFCLSLILFFLFVQKMFSFKMKNTFSIILALIASLIYAVLPSMIPRTVAGIPEIESLGMVFFWGAFYFFLCAWKSNKRTIIFSLLSALCTGLMAFTWGGYRYIFMTIASFSFLMLIFNHDKKKNFMAYAPWAVLSLLMVFIKSKMVGTGFISFSDTGLALIIFVFLLLDLLFTKQYDKLSKKIKIPPTIISVIISFIFLIVLVLIMQPTMVTSAVLEIGNGLLHPFGEGRIGLTVAENRAPYVTEAMAEFGNIFWLFLFGMILLFYEAVIHFDKKKKWVIFSLFVIFLFTFIFSRYSSTSILNGNNFISNLLYFGGALVFLIGLIFIFVKAFRKNDEKTIFDFKLINPAFVFLIVLSLWMIVSMRGAVRLFFIINPITAIIASYFLIKPIELGFNKENWKKMIPFFLVATIILVVLSLSFIQDYKQSSNIVKSEIPSYYTIQWQKAMAWVRTETPKDSIFVHWWDYGYWVQTMGERPTVTDGGHANGFWDHVTARYIMTAQEEKTALQACKSYNASYYLLDSTDIGKYSAFASIGSDSTGKDRLSWISTFLNDPKQTLETKEDTKLVYLGGTALDEDIIIGSTLIPEGKAGIGGFVISIDKQNQIMGIESVIVYNGQQYRRPVRYFAINGEMYDLRVEKDYLDGCLYLMPQIVNNQISNIGASLFITKKGMNTEWVRLFLFNNSTNFVLAYQEDNVIVADLKRNNMTNSDFIYYNGVMGPIKIFKINYPADIKYYPEYSQVNVPVEESWAKLDYLGK